MLRNKIVWIILLLSGIIFFHNITTYTVTAGMDYWRREIYARIISHEFRFPTYEETTEVYDAPLFYFVSGLTARLISAIHGLQWTDSLGIVRFGSAILSLASFWLWYRIFLEFYPKNKFGPIIFTLLLISLPVFYKAGSMYVSELMTLFFSTITIYFFSCRWLKSSDLKNTFWLAVLMSLGLLNRISFFSIAFTILAVIFIWFWQKKTAIEAIKSISIIVLILTLLTGWFYLGRHQGKLLSFGTYESITKKEPLKLSFYWRLPIKVLMLYPFRPVLSEPPALWPIYYADFWGDYWNYFPQTRFGQAEFTTARSDRQAFSPARKKYLAWQSRINLIPTGFMIISFFYLLTNRIQSILKNKLNRKIAAELTILIMTVLTWLSLIAIVTKYPGQGDLIKATYTTYIAPVYVYATVVVLFEYCARKKFIFWPAIIILLLTAVNNFIFSWF